MRDPWGGRNRDHDTTGGMLEGFQRCHQEYGSWGQKYQGGYKEATKIEPPRKTPAMATKRKGKSKLARSRLENAEERTKEVLVCLGGIIHNEATSEESVEKKLVCIGAVVPLSHGRRQ